MKTKSEFEKILDAKLWENTGAGAEARAEPTQSGCFFFADFLSKLFFNQGSVRVAAFGQTSYKKSESAASDPHPHQPTAEDRAKSQNNPKSQNTPRQKRKRSFDQLKALKVFTQFGEKQIDECSTDDEIRQAYRRLARRFHPDAGAASDDPFKILSAAYKKLMAS